MVIFKIKKPWIHCEKTRKESPQAELFMAYCKRKELGTARLMMI